MATVIPLFFCERAISTPTSPQRGEVDLRSKSGEGVLLPIETVTPHPALRADLSRWER